MSLAVELHNTLRMSGGELVDVLEDEELVELRDTVRQALQAVVAGKVPTRATLEALNRAAARAPSSPSVEARSGELAAVTDYHGASRADITHASIAADAIGLITGPRANDLRACGAPGCVLLFLKDHPRRAWCSDACGNRARQARHYARRHA